jgi:hypothetical protein
MPDCVAGACTYNQRDVIFVGDISQALKIRDAAARVANALDEKTFGLVVDVLCILLPCLHLGPSYLNTQTREQGFEKAVGATVQVDRRHHIVTGTGEADDGVEYSSLSGTRAHSRSTSL